MSAAPARLALVPDKEKPTLLVIDGHSLAFRAFYALPVDSFTTRDGQHTNAIHGFLSMLTAFAVGAWGGVRLDGTVCALVNGIWFWSACIFALAWTVVQKHGEPART